MSLLESILFFDINSYPPKIKYNVTTWLGCNACFFGGGERINEIHSLKNGTYARDKTAEKKIFLSKYNESILSEDDIRVLNKYTYQQASNLDYESKEYLVYFKLLNFLHYAYKLGKDNEIKLAINNINSDPTLHYELDLFLDLLESFNQNDSE